MEDDLCFFAQQLSTLQSKEKQHSSVSFSVSCYNFLSEFSSRSSIINTQHTVEQLRDFQHFPIQTRHI